MTNQDENRTQNASLAGLMRIEDSADEWTDRDLEAIWRHQLQASIAEQFGVDDAETSADTSFEQLFQSDRPSLERLQQIKRFAKSDAGLPREVAGVLYLVAIADARLCLGERITESPDTQLAKKLQWAAGRSWLDPATQQLLLKASASLLP